MKSRHFQKSQFAILLLSVMLTATSALAQNPVPSISTPLFPETLAPGGPSFVLTVRGTGFVPSSVVQWNGTALPTTFDSSNQVKANVPSANIASPSTAWITVSNGGVTSNVGYFEVTNATTSVSFNPQSSYNSGGFGPGAVAVGDFNGDGRLDLAVGNSNGTVSILLGNGEGTFQPAVPYFVAGGPGFIAVGDFNGDGKLDLAVASFNGTVIILLGNGDGTFTAASGPPAAVGNFPESIAVGDFNGDGKLDLAVANYSDNTVSILLGNGDGSFTAASASPIPVGNGPRSVAVGDFNGDGNPDLVVANYNDNTVSLLLGNGNGSFASASGSPFTVTLGAQGKGPLAIAVGDVDGDGNLDVVVANNKDNSVTILFGDGNGLFPGGEAFPVAAGPDSVAIGDFNGDGNLDVLVANLNAGAVTMALGPSFAQTTFSGFNPSSIAIGDFNGDGRMDLAVVNYSFNDVSILLQPTPTPPPSGSDITDVTAGSGLSGGGTNGDITLSNTGILSLAAGTGLLSSGGQTPTLTLNTSFTDGRYLQLTGGTLLGGLAAPSFSGSAAGLTNLNPANLTSGTAGINITGSAANALALGGVGPAGYIQNNSGPAQTANLDISGNAGIGGNASVTGNLATNGTLTLSATGTPITGHFSILVNPIFPVLKGGACARANFGLGGAADGDTIALGVPSGRMTSNATVIYTAWVSAPNTVTVQACDILGTQKTAGTGSIRIDLWKH